MCFAREFLDMPCVITILLVKGFRVPGSSSPHTLHVEGSAEGCQRVHVETTCFKGEGIAEVDEQTGTWEIDIPYPGGPDLCNCGDRIRIKATCMEDTACRAVWDDLLDCEDKIPCPNVYRITETPGTCKDGTREVKLVADVWPPDGAGVEYYKWEFGDGQGSDDTIWPGDPRWPQAGKTETTFDFPAPGSSANETEYLVTFIVVPQESPPCTIETKTKRIKVKGCGAPCPEIQRIKLTPVSCTPDNQKRIVLLEAFDGGGVTEYIWDFGDGSNPESTQDRETSHEYNAPGTYHGKLTIHGPGDCESEKPFDVTVEACGEDRPPTTPTDGDECPWWKFWECWEWDLCTWLGILLAILVALYLVGIATGVVSPITDALANVGVAITAEQLIGLLGGGVLAVLLSYYLHLCGLCNWGKALLAGVIVAAITIIIMYAFGVALPGLLGAIITAVVFVAAAIPAILTCE